MLLIVSVHHEGPVAHEVMRIRGEVLLLLLVVVCVM